MTDLKIFRGKKLSRMRHFETFRGKQLSRKGPKNAKPRKFLPAKVSDLKVILTTHENNIQNQIVFGNSLSDHDLIGVNRKINFNRFKPRKTIVRNYKRCDKEKFRSSESIVA